MSFLEDVKYPPEYKPIPCKPIFYDLAWNYISFPDFSDRYKKAGIFTRTIGKLWGKS